MTHLLRRVIVTAMAISLLFFAGITLYSLIFPRDLCELRVRNPETTSFIERYKEERRIRTRKTPAVSLTFTPLAEISPFLKEAVVFAEDPRFYSHPGIDIREIWESFKVNIRKGRWVRGGSTIPQQVVKNLYLSPEKSLLRKWREIILTLRLSHCVPRSRILEIYLNIIEWGPGIYGITQASAFYFGKKPKDLTLQESALLAAVLPNPRRFKVSHPPRRILKRAEWIEDQILDRD